jgi:hypothetical protein
MLQDFEPVDLGKFEIEQHHRGPGSIAFTELIATVEVIQRLLTVTRHGDLIDQVVFLKGRQGEFDIPRIVLNQENASQFSHVAPCAGSET